MEQIRFSDKTDREKSYLWTSINRTRAQLSALEKQMQWYEDTAKRFPNWEVVGRYIDRVSQVLRQRKDPRL